MRMVALILVGSLFLAYRAVGGTDTNDLKSWPGAQALDLAVSNAATFKPKTPLTAANRAALSVWNTVISGMTAQRQELMRTHVKIFLIPRDHRLMDVVASVLKRELPADKAKEKLDELTKSYVERLGEPGSRTSKEPRGLTVGNVIDNDAVMFCFAGAENLAFPAQWDENGNRMGRILVHELGHAAYVIALTEQERNDLKTVFSQYAQIHKSFKYKDGDENEGLALVTERWFGVQQSGLNEAGPSGLNDWGVGWIQFFQKIYGPFRDIRSVDPSLNHAGK